MRYLVEWAHQHQRRVRPSERTSRQPYGIVGAVRYTAARHATVFLMRTRVRFAAATQPCVARFSFYVLRDLRSKQFLALCLCARTLLRPPTLLTPIPNKRFLTKERGGVGADLSILRVAAANHIATSSNLRVCTAIQDRRSVFCVRVRVRKGTVKIFFTRGLASRDSLPWFPLPRGVCVLVSRQALLVLRAWLCSYAQARGPSFDW